MEGLLLLNIVKKELYENYYRYVEGMSQQTSSLAAGRFFLKWLDYVESSEDVFFIRSIVDYAFMVLSDLYDKEGIDLTGDLNFQLDQEQKKQFQELKKMLKKLVLLERDTMRGSKNIFDESIIE